MRVVLCDGDDLLRSMVELVVERHGHQMVGVAGTVADAVGLIEHARPDVAIIDLALGVNADFDLLGSAISVDVPVIVFSNTAYEELLNRYSVRPVVVPKPDLDALGEALDRLAAGASTVDAPPERRRRPARQLAGSPPTGVGDAQAFYEALSSAVGGDALVWIDVGTDGPATAERVTRVMRSSDRLFATPDAIRVFLVGGGAEGVEAFRQRLEGVLVATGPDMFRSVVISPDEAPTDAFDRLRRP